MEWAITKSRRSVLSALLFAVFAASAVAAPRVLTIDLDRAIHPLTAEIVRQGIEQASADGAAAILIRLNTPGGLLSATNDINQAIIASEVPVITYVTPSGGRAASAGFLILISGDIAAMAPGTNTGAAHPVLAVGGEMDEVMKAKVENDAAASLRAIAEKRGRNVELAEKAVRESSAFTDGEALEGDLIDFVAADAAELFAAIDGQPFLRFDGTETTLALAGAEVYPFELTFRQRALLPLVDPSLAFILLIVGLLGVYAEFTNPGLIFPGVFGGIAVVLGLMALSVLPINWAGVALILLGITFLTLEAMTATNGILGAGGAVAMALGAVMLIDTEIPELSIGWGTAIAATLPFAVITVFLVQLAVKSFRYKVATGAEAMVGEIGVARGEVAGAGRVFVHGELWNAHAASPVLDGMRVRVTGVDGLNLEVEPVEPKQET